MLRTMVQSKGYPHDPARRGYGIVYRRDETNHCPGCGRTHWYVGRVSAECGFCSTALPLGRPTLLLGRPTRTTGARPDSVERR